MRSAAASTLLSLFAVMGCGCPRTDPNAGGADLRATVVVPDGGRVHPPSQYDGCFAFSATDVRCVVVRWDPGEKRWSVAEVRLGSSEAPTEVFGSVQSLALEARYLPTGDVQVWSVKAAGRNTAAFWLKRDGGQVQIYEEGPGLTSPPKASLLPNGDVLWIKSVSGADHCPNSERSDIRLLRTDGSTSSGCSWWPYYGGCCPIPQADGHQLARFTVHDVWLGSIDDAGVVREDHDVNCAPLAFYGPFALGIGENRWAVKGRVVDGGGEDATDHWFVLSTADGGCSRDPQSIIGGDLSTRDRPRPYREGFVFVSGEPDGEQLATYFRPDNLGISTKSLGTPGIGAFTSLLPISGSGLMMVTGSSTEGSVTLQASPLELR